MNLAEILVFRGVNQLYTYLVPEKNAALYKTGYHVEVPFGKYTASGLIISINKKKLPASLSRENLKTISKTLPDRPNLGPDIIDLILWFSSYYQVSPYKSYQTILGNKKVRKLENNKIIIPKLTADYSMTKDQQDVISTILNNTGEHQTFLLHGVTSSGKTEVYMQIATRIISKNQKVLILLPEIALTPQYIKVFSDRFSHNIAILHSGLTPKEKEIEWNKIYAGQVDIVIGPRSAIFAPVKDIGVIIIDEEHEQTYKQENNPRYFTHTIARYRAKTNNSLLIYGSATPSIDTYSQCFEKHNINDSQVKLVKLTKRVSNRPMPTVEIVDMKEEIIRKNTGPLSLKLQEAIESKLRKKEKIIILLNRRGYATYVSCQKCGEILTCPQCNLSYTYHKDKKFRCHRCATQAPIYHTCPKCNKDTLGFSGTGIQKVELELRKFFPDSRINRLDRDSAKTAKQMENILSEFKKDGDILLGTQLIAKGHHIDEVTLVGVLGIDTTLNIPDFRAPERTFQLLTQVAGRAGRGEKKGTVIIQTFQPGHYAVQHASKHDFESFYKEEISYRKELWYPSFSALINIIFSAKNEEPLKRFADSVYEKLEKETAVLKEKVKITGPKPAPVEMIQNNYRWNILLKCEHNVVEKIKKTIKNLPKPPSSVRLIIDFDPKSIL